ncbi:hydrogenase expression/formation protein HypE [Veillonella agrestimuris]|uniref:hydrogenase expression/formation protein HypE n=1 Tax=Veillonella agrestimuris TaxID=2941340 RepID=UPI00203F5531|nr:hydrogenase expression/formation protein HypE [Veillonella agrestimuris]
MDRVRLVHGNGGRFSHELTERFILKYFHNDLLATLHDGAQFPVTNGRMAFSTDSYVVQPQFFPGGNIGKLAVCGTVNDLAMNGAIPQYLSCSLILEEGFPFDELEEILKTMGNMAKAANVQIVTGDTKVVKQGEVDKIYINTAGVGMIPERIHIAPSRVKANMDIIISGSIGDHSIAVMGQRFGLELSPMIQSDCAPLNHMVQAVLSEVGDGVALMRDPTRGGLGTVLHEIATQCQVGVKIEQSKLIVHDEVQSVCDILGYDPLYLANEGKVLFVVDPSVTEQVLHVLRSFPEGKEATLIGHTLDKNIGKVGMQTSIGGMRLIDALGEDQVPRIC